MFSGWCQEGVWIMTLWGVLWRSDNLLEGKTEYILWENQRPLIFDTRKEARDFISQRYAYIRGRSDLRTEPHGWKMPKPVPVGVQVLSLA